MQCVIILFPLKVAITEEQEAEFSRATELDGVELVKVEGTKMKLSKELIAQWVYKVEYKDNGVLMFCAKENVRKRNSQGLNYIVSISF